MPDNGIGQIVIDLLIVSVFVLINAVRTWLEILKAEKKEIQQVL